MRASTIHAFYETAAQNAARPAVRFRAAGKWKSLNWAEYANGTRKVARGLISLGVAAGDRVAIFGANRIEWLLSDLAAVAGGGAPSAFEPTVPVARSSELPESSASMGP